MESLEKDIKESENGALVYNTSVVRVDPYRPRARDASSIGWVVQLQTQSTEQSHKGSGHVDAILAKTLITSTGLAGPLILNALLPPMLRIPTFYARGSYASYNGPGLKNVKRLLYPCPHASAHDKESFQSLGTHLTLDLSGKVRFGPDIEWIVPSVSDSESLEPEFWEGHLQPSSDSLPAMHAAITSYLPHVTLSGLRPDYVGIRPKLVGPGGNFVDFIIRKDYVGGIGGTKPRQGILLSLLGIESPGLTASLGIAEMVVKDMLGVPD